MQKTRTRTGRVKTRPWQDDPDIRARLRLVESVYGQPAHRALDIVNRQLEARGDPAISYDQFMTDKQHVRELFQEERPGGLADHVTRLLREQSEVERDVQATPPGPARATLRAVWVRIEEDIMKIDGTWGSQQPAPGIEVDQSSFGPSPQELLARGEIDHATYRQFLVILAGSTTSGRQEQQHRAALAPPGGVIEGRPVVEPEEPEEPPVASQGAQGRTLRRGRTTTRAPGPVPGSPRLGDELPHVVEWDGAGEDFE